MPQPEANVWVAAFTIFGAMASMATWVVLLRRRSYGPLLAYAPRRPVPWGAYATLLAISLVLLKFVAPPDNPEWLNSDLKTTYDIVQWIVSGMLQTLFLTGVFFAVVVGVSKATQRDVGLPVLASELGRDFRIGAVACLAALVPVIGLQALLISALGPPTEHPIVQIVVKDPQPLVMGLSFVAAVFVAPVCEEVAFRLLLQGWLEKWEDQLLFVPTSDEPSQMVEMMESGRQGDMEIDAADTSAGLSASETPHLTFSAPARGVFGLPHGWLPILASSLLFSLAHLGHGTDPLPLFFLAIILGYSYQRTHHIVPSIVTHMLFNLLSLISLGLSIYAG
jgi:membrane protease YdiL (CAAX protease family)